MLTLVLSGRTCYLMPIGYISSSEPLYQDSRITTIDAWHGIMHFSLTNHLPFAAISHLLQLLHFILPESHLPRTLYRLKQQYYSGTIGKQQFCSCCLQKVPDGMPKCSNPVCQRSSAELCWYVPVSFFDHLESIYKGTLTGLYT